MVFELQNEADCDGFSLYGFAQNEYSALGLTGKSRFSHFTLRTTQPESPGALQDVGPDLEAALIAE